MNKRIKKKRQRKNSKIPKYIIRLAKRWSGMDTNIANELEWLLASELNYPKKAISNNIRKRNRIVKFLKELDDNNFGVCYYGFSIHREPRGDYQQNGEYCYQTGYDDYYTGIYYYPIGNGLYLGCHYEC